MLAKFFGYVFSLSKITYQQKSVRISQTFFAIYIYISLTYKCEKCELIECFAKVPCKRQSSVNSGAWLRRFDDVTGVAKIDTLR